MLKGMLKGMLKNIINTQHIRYHIDATKYML
jgi:hypothetical protein